MPRIAVGSLTIDGAFFYEKMRTFSMKNAPEVILCGEDCEQCSKKMKVCRLPRELDFCTNKTSVMWSAESRSMQRNSAQARPQEMVWFRHIFSRTLPRPCKEGSLGFWGFQTGDRASEK
jgi:hypothetical protein